MRSHIISITGIAPLNLIDLELTKRCGGLLAINLIINAISQLKSDLWAVVYDNET